MTDSDGGRTPAGPVATELAARVPPGSPLNRLADVADDLIAPAADLVANLPASFTPAVAACDVLDWMQVILGVEARHLLTTEQSRRVLATIVASYLSRGTAKGLTALLEIRYGIGVRIEDSGGTVWSATPGTPPAGPGEPLATIHLDTDDDLPGLDDVIQSALPAHVRYRVITRAVTTDVHGVG